MWVSSFVVTLPDDSERADSVRNALCSVPVFETGPAVGCRLPVVLEAEDGSAARYWHDWVEGLPGVIQVEVAFVSFEDTEQPDSAQSSAEEPSFVKETT